MCGGICRILRSISGHYPLDASSISQTRQPEMSPDIGKCLLGERIPQVGKNSPNPPPTCMLCCPPSRYSAFFLKILLSEGLSESAHQRKGAFFYLQFTDGRTEAQGGKSKKHWLLQTSTPQPTLLFHSSLLPSLTVPGAPAPAELGTVTASWPQSLPPPQV